MLVTALHAAETLLTFHVQQVVQMGDERQAYHLYRAECCEDDIEDIRQRLAAEGVTDLDMRSRDVTAARRIVARHALPDWQADGRATRVLEGLAQEIADAMEAARGGRRGRASRRW